MKGRIAEIFESIQGEGIYLGARQLFVRFFGCNLNCKFCDTKLYTFKEYEPEGLLQELKLYTGNYHSISFTGGEPLFQKDFLKEILKLTQILGFKNYLETNGTLTEALKEVIDYIDIVAMDLKLPSSTGLNNFWDAHRKFLELASQKEVFLKAVICQSTLEKDLGEAIKLIKEVNKNAIFVLQPNSYEDYNSLKEKLENFKDICAKENISARIICQMHKIVGIK
jgi:organic radical activating enzyme